MIPLVNAAVRPVFWGPVSVGFAALALLASGCTNLNIAKSKLQDVAPEREDRQKRFVENFENRRDESQYRAALSAWERGDARACEEQLVQLLRRKPTHRDARLALADLYLEGQSLEAAESHYRQLIEHHPDDAYLHYSLGLFLEITGRGQAARPHFDQAAKLEPENPLFATTAAEVQPARETSEKGSGAGVERASAKTAADS